MVNSNAFTAWRLFQLNWIPIAAMGAVVLLGGALCGFTIEPVALGITLAIAAALALIAYLYAFAKGDQADPKLIFPLGAISQLLLIATIMGPLTYVADRDQLAAAGSRVAGDRSRHGHGSGNDRALRQRP